MSNPDRCRFCDGTEPELKTNLNGSMRIECNDCGSRTKRCNSPEEAYATWDLLAKECELCKFVLQVVIPQIEKLPTDGLPGSTNWPYIIERLEYLTEKG